MTKPTAAQRLSEQRLGKLPVRIDVRTLSLVRYVDRRRLPSPPPAVDEASAVDAWPLYANDRIGDCTVTAAAHMIEAWTAACRGEPVVISDRSVVAAFQRVKTVDPDTGEDGAVALDVLRHWRKSGIARHRIGAFARVPVHEIALVRTAAWLFGGLYIGVQLPLTAETQETWDWTRSLAGRARPGSWGGHAVNVVGYDARGVAVVTWDRVMRMTWSFWDRYVDECYCILSKDFLDAGKAPNGFYLAALEADLALVTA